MRIPASLSGLAPGSAFGWRLLVGRWPSGHCWIAALQRLEGPASVRSRHEARRVRGGDHSWQHVRYVASEIAGQARIPALAGPVRPRLGAQPGYLRRARAAGPA